MHLLPLVVKHALKYRQEDFSCHSNYIFVSHWADVQNILLRFILILMVISCLPSVKLTVVLFRPQVQVSDVLERWQQRPSRSRVGGIGSLGPGTLLSRTLHENVSGSSLKTTCLVLCPDIWFWYSSIREPDQNYLAFFFG